MTPQELVQSAFNHQPFPQTDDWRCPGAQQYWGGFLLHDKELQGRLRSAVTEVIKIVGKKIISGKFNLATISFPIKLMTNLSLLRTIPTF